MVSALRESFGHRELANIPANSNPAMGMEIFAPPFDPTAGVVVLICDQALTDSVLIAPHSPGVAVAAVYSKLVTGMLERGNSKVIFHLGQPQRSARDCYNKLSQKYRGRLRVIEAAPIEPMLAYVDFLVSFASPALIEGCRNGLKPIQIGNALIGSEAFSHIFSDVDGFVDAVASGTLEGRLSLQEYGRFEQFCQSVNNRAGAELYVRSHGLRYAGGISRDPILRECRRPEFARLSPLRAIFSAIANPVAAWRLLRIS